MVLEIDIDFLNKIENLTLDQLVFLNLVLGENQNKTQIASQVLSLISEENIQDLINRELLSVTTEHGVTQYEKTDKLIELLGNQKDWFDEFLEYFPTMVHRPDGTKGYLKTNINKCRKYYKQIVGNSKAKHEHILDCLRYEIHDKTITGKLGYLKTMWKWLVNSEWEASEEQMKDESSKTETQSAYGTEIL